VEIHDAFLDPAVQEGHLHTAGLEAVILQKGSIDAVIWDEEKTEVFPLRDWGDLIIFPPDCRHTLLVKEKSRISVVKNFSASPWKDRRKVAELPTGLEAIRQELLAGGKSTKEALIEKL
jgi:cupin superfamily acireductone dioxygenase involved in methionine salvage